MSNSVQQTGSSNARRSVIAGSGDGSLASSLFVLFAIELLLIGMVVWSFLVNRHSYPECRGNITDPVWGLIALAAGVWGTWYLIMSRQATRSWNIPHSRNLLTIVVTSGAILLGVLLLNIASMFVRDSVYMDVRPLFAATGGSAKSETTAAIIGDGATGKKWFSQTCVTCHGPAGDGVANAAPSLRASDFLKTADDVAIAALIRNGRTTADPANKTGKVMPAKGGNPFLDESKIADLVAFLHDLDGQFAGQAATAADSAPPDYATLQDQLTNESPRMVQKWSLADLANLDLTPGEESISLGMRAFVKGACNKCHISAIAGQALGPTLDQIVKKYPRDKLLEHIVAPSTEINENFQPHTFLLTDGRTLTGVITKRSAEEIEIISDLLKPDQRETILTANIQDQVKSKVSAMPADLLNVLTQDEIAALIVYVDAAGNQTAAAAAPQLNRWVVPAAASDPVPSSWATQSSTWFKTFVDSIRSKDTDRYNATFSWLFVIATSVLAVHFLWVVGSGTAIVMHRELQLSSSRQMRLAQQTFLFWSIGVGWLVLWFVLFFLVG